VSSTQETPVSLWRLFLQYLEIGIVGFGPSLAAETKKRLVKGLKWISEEEFVNGMALGQLLPGATFVSLTVYIGYRLRGVAGAIISFLGLLLAPFLFMLLLSYIYFTYGSLSGVNALFKGMAVVVAGLVAHAIIEIGKSAVTDWKGIVVALAALGVMLYYPNIFVLLILSAIAGITLYYQSLKQAAAGVNHPDTKTKFPVRKFIVLATILTVIAYLVSWEPVLFQLGWVFFRMGAFVFGNGFTMIPLIQQEVVNNYHWLSVNDFMVGLAFGQITPGPVLITATFVGYKVASVTGAIAATLGIFLPSLFLVMATSEIHQKIKHNPMVKAAIKGMMAAFTGMMVLVVIGLARDALVDIPSAIIALVTFGLLRFGKMGTLWVVIGGTAVYWLWSTLAIGLP
jgi:chromate transporter